MADKSLAKKITVGSTTLVVCAFTIALVANYWHALAQAEAAHKEELTHQLALLSQSLENPLWALDIDTVKLIGDAYMAGADAVSLKILSEHDKEALYNQERAAKAKVIYGQLEVFHNNEIIGHISLGLSGASHAAPLLRQLIYSIILGSFIVLSLALFMKRLFRKHLIKPLKTLGDWTDRVASGDYEETPPQIELEELSSLAKKFSNMSEKIQKRTLSLQVSERRFRELFENTEVSIWDEDISDVFTALESLRQKGVTDLRQHLENNRQSAWDIAAMVKVIQVNEATLKLFGAKNHDEMLTQIEKTLGPKTIEVFIDELCAIWDKQRIFRSEASYTTLDGKELNAIVSFHIPETPEGFSSLPVCIADITDLKRAEEELVKYHDQLEILVEDRTAKLKEAQSELLQRERLATLGRLTATVSHELRNPLGTIQTALCSIAGSLDRSKPHPVDRSLELAERSINRCVNIIEELNNYTRVKKLELSKTPIDEWVKTLLDEQSLPEEILCEVNLTSGVRASIDREKLRQVMVNLITNAEHALMDERSKGKKLQVSTNLLDSQYEICVYDDGIGMSDETSKKMFEPLYSTKGFGVGLGMVIAKAIIEQHRGELSVKSKEKEGTKVCIRLPVSLPEH